MVQGTEAGTRIRLAWPDVGPEELAAVAEVLESGFLTMGPKVAEFESALAHACSTEHAVAVSSGTAALHLAVLALGIGEGDEVIVPAYTFPATASAVALTGARPVLVDVDPRTMNVDPSRVYDAVTPATRAVIAVHLFGRPLDWEALQAAVAPDVELIEDAAGALGARWRGMPCGGLGVMGCLSFHPRKVVTTGEGGAVTTSDDGLDAAVRRLRHHGIASQGDFEIESPSTNYRLSDLQCAIGIPQLARLDELLAARRRIAEAYNERLRGTVEIAEADEGDEHGWQAYVVQLDRRDDAVAALRAEGIEAQIGTYALHRLRAYHDQGPFPAADACFRRALALPLHSRLSDSDVDRVCSVLTQIVS
ncbi:MAG: DegT/DnrJ/EryC1/StrS family aminotransferase [Actinobacteria bacterium]|nr:MAG: DegT/DnrJ/EryC1/StrS family aminotransferase [Actinomycetota bacterium]